MKRGVFVLKGGDAKDIDEMSRDELLQVIDYLLYDRREKDKYIKDFHRMELMPERCPP